MGNKSKLKLAEKNAAEEKLAGAFSRHNVEQKRWLLDLFDEGPRLRGGSARDLKKEKLEKEPFQILAQSINSRFLKKNYRLILPYLKRFVLYHDFWLHDPKDWKPSSHNVLRQMGSLAKYLFAKYDIPAHLFNCWDGDNKREQGYYIDIATGVSVKKIIPLKITKKQAHLFLKAPGNLNFGQAVRWAQITSLGGDKSLVDATLKSGVGDAISNRGRNEFILSMVQFFVNNPMLDRQQFDHVNDYVNHVKYGHETLDGVGGRIQPDFTFSGRAPLVLLEQVEAWHKDLAKAKVRKFIEWPPTSIGEFVLEESNLGNKNHKIWMIEELTSNKVLSREGKAMHHCVYSYVESCRIGRASIWSMTLTSGGSKERCLTVEVSSKRISQVYGSCNRSSTSVEDGILNRWAAQEGLSY